MTKEWMLIVNRWYQVRNQVFGIPESKEPVTKEEKLDCQTWLRDFGIQTVVSAMYDVIRKGKKHAGYHPRFRHIGVILRRDYLPLSERKTASFPPEKRYIGQLPDDFDQQAGGEQ